MIEHRDPQGSEAWVESRRGVITASRAKDARAFKKNGESASERLAYAMDLARERLGGKAPSPYVNAAMRTGTEEEPFGVIEYVAQTGAYVEEACFITVDDRKFGLSLDRWVGKDRKAALEVKTMVSSATLFKAIVEGDISEYRDQCLFALWMLGLEWVDLCLWCPDLQTLNVVRINRDENEIQKLEGDLMSFERLVSEYEARLRKKLKSTDSAPWGDQAPAARPELPEYPAADFEKNFPAWSELVADGKRTSSALLAMLSTKATFSEEQQARILSLKPAAQDATPAPATEPEPAAASGATDDDLPWKD